MITVYYKGEKRQYADQTKYLEMAREIQSEYPCDIVLAAADGKPQELGRYMKHGTEVTFFTAQSQIGMMTYRRSVLFLMLKALHDCVPQEELANHPVKVDFSLSKGFFCHFNGAYSLSEKQLTEIEDRMRQLVAARLPIEKENVSIEKAMELFHRYRMHDKEKLFRYRRVSNVNLYRINEFQDYFYGYMTPDTGYLRYFALFPYEDGFVLQMPSKSAPEIVPAFEPQHKVYRALRESGNWGTALGVSNVGELNDLITGHHTGDGPCREITELILIQEALMEKKMAEIADAIVQNPGKKLIMIAGPSSSGKTTFSHRLSIQLKAAGLRPHPIAVDDYFVDRENSPRDEEGNYNFEDLECIDVKQFNADMKQLLAGKTVSMPTYNFKTGHREYRGHELTLGPEDILVIEGIHCLNPALYPTLSADSIFRIYISALTQINVDEHNRIPTTDGRLIRRMVRDARTRGASAKDTIAMWNNVRKGEEKNIFPYQETADVVFNSALIYELAVLKQYAEPLLFSIDKKDPEYMEAKRLLKFFDYFVGINSEKIPMNSILREFIGGSCFEV